MEQLSIILKYFKFFVLHHPLIQHQLPTFSVTCSYLDAPIIAQATFGF